MAAVEYIEFPNAKRLRFRWNAITQPNGFISVGNGVAFVEKDDELIGPPKFPDAVPDDLGGSRYRWTEGLRQSAPWAVLILVLPPGFTMSDPVPAIANAKIFGNRIAVYWALRGDDDGHAAIEWTLAEIGLADPTTHVQELLRSSSTAIQTPQIEQTDAVDSNRSEAPASFQASHPLDEAGTPSLLRFFRWIQRDWRKKLPYAAAFVIISFLTWTLMPKLFQWRASFTASESLFATVSAIGFAPADSSIFVDMTFRNDGDANATVINSFIAVSDTSFLPARSRGVSILYAQGPLRIDLASGESHTKRIYFHHSISARLKQIYGVDRLLSLSINFVSLDKQGNQHWATCAIGSLLLLNHSEIPGLSSLRDVIRIRLLPTDAKPPFPATPPFEQGGMMTLPATAIPPTP